MTTFAIATDNNITAFTAAEQVPEGQDRFATEKEFAKLSAEWPIARFVEVWNGFAGAPPFGDLKPVKKFTDRKTAVARIWKAIQTLGEELLRASIRDAEAKLKAVRTAPAPAQQAAPVAPKKARATKGATEKDVTATPREGSKKAIVLELIRRADGASLQEIMSATNWQAHSVRGFISGALTKKMGLTVESLKTPEGARVYRIAAK
jgi:ribosomal protein L7/L12